MRKGQDDLIEIVTRAFVAQTAGDEQCEHAEITYERPPGMGEGCGCVPLDHGMSDPGEAVTRHQGGRQKSPVGGEDRNRQQYQAQASADGMKQLGQRLAVLGQVSRPESAIVGAAFRHGFYHFPESFRAIWSDHISGFLANSLDPA